jgi:hypothetical protein
MIRQTPTTVPEQNAVANKHVGNILSHLYILRCHFHLITLHETSEDTNAQ